MSTEEEIAGWVAGRVPAGWFEGAPEVVIDREEILVIGRLSEVTLGGDASADAIRAARAGRINQFREDTREQRIRISQEAQRRLGRAVSWGARCGDAEEIFTTLSVPVMTRLHIRERQLLDALVESGVARSRSHALAWCARLVAQHEGDWLKQLQESLAEVRQVRGRNPLN